MPKIRVPIPPRPAIGTVRFVGAPTLRRLIEHNDLILMDGLVQVNPYGPDGGIRADYDGWVFPTGSEIENRGAALSAASLVYAGSKTSNFTVPEFSQFFRIDMKNLNASMEIMPSQVGLKRHVHQTGVHNFDGTMTLNSERTELFSKSGNSNGPAGVHWGRTYDN